MGDEKFNKTIDQDGNPIQELSTEADVNEAAGNFSRHVDRDILASVMAMGLSLSMHNPQPRPSYLITESDNIRDQPLRPERYNWSPPKRLVVPNKKAEARKTRREKNRAAGKARLTTKRGK